MDREKLNHYIDLITENCASDLAIDKYDSMVKYVFSIITDLKERTELFYELYRVLNDLFEGMTYIPEEFFIRCKKIKEITISKNIKKELIS